MLSLSNSSPNSVRRSESQFSYNHKEPECNLGRCFGRLKLHSGYGVTVLYRTCLSGTGVTVSLVKRHSV